MAEYNNEKFYWLKLKKGFFKRHDIIVIENLPNGKDYVLFYLKLLCESIDHNGELRFSKTIPYNEQMLSSITNTNIDIVHRAIELFVELGLVEILDSGTIYLTSVGKMVGSQTISAAKKQEQRQLSTEKSLRGQEVDNRPLEIEIEIEKDIDISAYSPNSKEESLINACAREKIIHRLKEIADWETIEVAFKATGSIYIAERTFNALADLWEDHSKEITEVLDRTLFSTLCSRQRIIENGEIKEKDIANLQAYVLSIIKEKKVNNERI